MKLFQRCAAVLAVATVVAGGSATEAGAAQSTTRDTFGPTVITDVPKAPDTTKGEKATQKVVPLATISTSLPEGRTAYVYSTLTANEADDVNLIDNEVRCSGAGTSNVVMGENVMPRTSTNPLREITIVTRFLVTATKAGTLTCNQFLRTASTSPNVSKETVKSELRFASEDVVEGTNGAALQRSLPKGSTPVRTTTVTPVLNGTVPDGMKELAVIADVEFHRCTTTTKCSTKARFALTVTTSGGANCPSAPVAQIERTLQRGVNHAAVPLYTIVPVKPGCTAFDAKVTTTHLAGDPGTVGGAAPGLTDETGVNGSKPNHESAMTHIFAVPS